MNYLFGCGSIINDLSRRSTLLSTSISNLSHGQSIALVAHGEGGSYEGDESVAAYISPSFATRNWCFRSSTGFTAIGLTVNLPKGIGFSDEANSKHDTIPICGILFPVSTNSLACFDVREVGYQRVQVPLSYITIDETLGCQAAKDRAIELKQKIKSDRSNMLVWAYVPDYEHYHFPDEEFPIIQTYVDICLLGCLQWGGFSLAQEFLRSTSGWNEFYLNDAPMSRRPWLHRIDYNTIDACLESEAKHVHYFDRKHPEEYAASHLTALRGMWGVPSRNAVFVGREDCLASIHQKLTGISPCDNKSTKSNKISSTASLPLISSNQSQEYDLSNSNSNSNINSKFNDSSSSSNTKCNSFFSVGLRQVEIIGLGGVGKTQLSTEYVYRYFGSYYGLVSWLRADSPVSIAADLRRLAFDLGILKTVNSNNQFNNRSSMMNNNSNNNSGNNKSENIELADELDDETVVEEVKRRLSRCKCKWLLVFDNVEDLSIIKQYLPRGHCRNSFTDTGHVLITSRIAAVDMHSSSTTSIYLNCFDMTESLRYLEVAIGQHEHSHIGLNHNSNSRNQILSLSPEGRGKGSRESLRSDENIEHDSLVLLAERLGHLPLALSMAAAYMLRCDLSAVEYLHRLGSLVLDHTSAGNFSSGLARGAGGDSIYTSLSMTLDRISRESDAASSVLPCLGYLSPDSITKKFIRLLLLTSHFKSHGPQPLATSTVPKFTNIMTLIVYLFGGLFLIIILVLLGKFNVNSYFSNLYLLSFFVILLSIAITTIPYLIQYYNQHNQEVKAIFFGIHSRDTTTTSISGKLLSLKSDSRHSPSTTTNNNEFINDEQVEAETDRVWDMLRQFSILSTRGSRLNRIGSIHRLQQSVLRTRNAAEECISIERCIWMIHSLWNFNPIDSASWDSCSDILEHVEVLAKHTIRCLSSSSGSDNMITKPAKDTSTSRSKIHKHNTGNNLRWYYCSKLAKLLTEAGSYSAVALSRFDTAEKFLNDASTIHLIMTNLEKHTYSHLIPHSIKLTFQSDKANTLHSLGKVLRYNGRLKESWDNLSNALSMRKKYSPNSPMVADTLHELGVLSLKRHNLTSANMYLTKSLDLKHLLGKKDVYNNNNKENADQIPSVINTNNFETSEAATLHQLAIVATAEKRYDSAEELLHRALRLEMLPAHNQHTHFSSGLISRAATLQQLGRVALRKGRLEAAEQQLNEALSLYKKAYGERRASCHINVAAVRHQLGATAVAAHRYDDASMNFTLALTARESLGSESFGGQLDVIFELQSLGQVELERGILDKAENIFRRERCLVERLLAADFSLTFSCNAAATSCTTNAGIDASSSFISFPTEKSKGTATKRDNYTSSSRSSSFSIPTATSSNSQCKSNRIKLSQNQSDTTPISENIIDLEGTSSSTPIITTTTSRQMPPSTEEEEDLQDQEIDIIDEQQRRLNILLKSLIFSIKSLRTISKKKNNQENVLKLTDELKVIQIRSQGITESVTRQPQEDEEETQSKLFQNKFVRNSIEKLLGSRAAVRCFCNTISSNLKLVEVEDNSQDDNGEVSLHDSNKNRRICFADHPQQHPIVISTQNILKELINLKNMEIVGFEANNNSLQNNNKLITLLQNIEKITYLYTERISVILENILVCNYVDAVVIDNLFGVCDDLRRELRAMGARVER